MKQSGSLFFKNTQDHKKKVQRATDRHKERNKKGGGERELPKEKSTISTHVIFTEPKGQRASDPQNITTTATPIPAEPNQHIT